MQILVKIEAVDKTSSMRKESLRIESVITRRIDTCHFTLEGTHTLTEGSDEIIISNTGETIRYFAGFITKIARDIEGITKLFHCTCQDYTILLDRVLVNEVYTDKTDAYILNDLFTKYLPEINATTYVATGKTHDRILFNRITLRQAIDMLSTDSGLDWYVDYNKNLRYFTKETFLAPFDISNDPDEVTTYPCSRLKYTRNATKIINRVIVIGGHYLSNDTNFELPGDAQTTELLMPYKMHAADGESELLVYKNDGDDGEPEWTSLGVGIDHIESLGGAIDILHNYQEKLLKFDTAPPDLKRAIKVTGRYDVPVLVRVRSEESYDKYGRWFDDKLVNKDINSRDWAALAGKGMLAKSAFQKEIGSYIGIQDGLFSGMRQKLTNALRGIDDYYLINKVITHILGGTQCQYEVHYGEYNPDLVDMIISLKARSTQFQEIRDDEVLNELFEQDESLALAEATDRHENDTPCTGRWIAEPPTQSAGHHVIHEALALVGAPTRAEYTTEAYRWG